MNGGELVEQDWHLEDPPIHEPVRVGKIDDVEVGDSETKNGSDIVNPFVVLTKFFFQHNPKRDPFRDTSKSGKMHIRETEFDD